MRLIMAAYSRRGEVFVPTWANRKDYKTGVYYPDPEGKVQEAASQFPNIIYFYADLTTEDV